MRPAIAVVRRFLILLGTFRVTDEILHPLASDAFPLAILHLFHVGVGLGKIAGKNDLFFAPTPTNNVVHDPLATLLAR
jgi:hypothetical protein